MNRIIKPVMTIIAACIVLEAAANTFRWARDPESEFVQNTTFIDNLTEAVVRLPVRLIDNIFAVVCFLVEGILNSGFELLLNKSPFSLHGEEFIHKE